MIRHMILLRVAVKMNHEAFRQKSWQVKRHVHKKQNLLLTHLKRISSKWKKYLRLILLPPNSNIRNVVEIRKFPETYQESNLESHHICIY